MMGCKGKLWFMELVSPQLISDLLSNIPNLMYGHFDIYYTYTLSVIVLYCIALYFIPHLLVESIHQVSWQSLSSICNQSFLIKVRLPYFLFDLFNFATFFFFVRASQITSSPCKFPKMGYNGYGELVRQIPGINLMHGGALNDDAKQRWSCYYYSVGELALSMAIDGSLLMQNPNSLGTDLGSRDSRNIFVLATKLMLYRISNSTSISCNRTNS